MRNKRSLILVFLILTTLLAACAPGWLTVAPLGAQPAGVKAVASLAVVAEPETDPSSGQVDQPQPEPPAAESPQPLALGRVNAQGLNLRAGPGANTTILGLLGEGTELDIQGRSENLKWLQVRVPGGAQGWVYAEYVTTQVVIASLPLKEAYGGPDSSPSSAGQDVRQPLNVQASIENNLATVVIAGFPADSRVIARLGKAGGAVDLQVGETVTTANGNGVIRFNMPATWPDGKALSEDELNLVVSTPGGEERVDVRVQYFQ